jgi:hypothetical protein
MELSSVVCTNKRAELLRPVSSPVQALWRARIDLLWSHCTFAVS